jgi:ubiquinone/menaquinone biosynthesis C-methylase UbiE
MPKRIVEQQHQEAFSGIESARAYYAQHARSPIVQRGYHVIADRIDELGLDGRFLEVGAGPAILTAIVAQAMPQVNITVIEVSPDMITVAREEVESQGVEDRIDFVEGDAADAALLDRLGKFDLVYSTYSLHHWDEPEMVIKNLLRAVAPGGVLFIHDLKRVWWLYWIPSREGFFTSIRAAYTPSEIEELLGRVGVDRYEIQNGPFYQSVVVRT